MRSLFTITALLFISGCFLHSAEHSPKPSVPLPEAFEHVESQQLKADEKGWWLAFEDGQLNTLMEQLFKDNLDMKAAFARLKQMQAVKSQAWASLWPQLSLESQASQQHNPNFFGTGQEFDTTNFSVQGGVSYEVDLWGKLGAHGKASVMEAGASRDQLEALAMSLSAHLAQGWYSYQAQRSMQTLLEEQLETNETFYELVELRYQQGLVPAYDLYQQEQQVAAARARLAQGRMSLQQVRNQLLVLLGSHDKTLLNAAETSLPELKAMPAVGLPVALLDQRPDVRAARKAVVAADERVVVALANLFPTLRFSAGVGFTATSLPELFNDMLWSVLGSLTQPLFAGGRLRADLKRAKALVDERIATFGQTVLEAYYEVDNALVREKEQAVYVQEVVLQEKAAKAALDEVRERYLQGLSDFLPVLSTLKSHQAAQRQRVEAMRQRIVDRIQLHRSLGGSWTRTIESKEASS